MKIVFFFILYFPIAVVFAQNAEPTQSIIQANVFSPAGDDIEYGLVFLFDSDTTLIKKTEISYGYFEIKEVAFGEYFLLIRASLYVDYLIGLDIDSSLIYFDSIILNYRDDKVTQDVEISYIKPKMTFDIGKFDVDVRDQPYFEGQRFLDILSKLPGVFVENGTIYLNGLPVSIVRIDGLDYSIESAMLILENLTSDDIQKIGIIKDEFAKSDASASGGVIEITLYVDKRKKHYFETMGELGHGMRFRNNQSIKYNFSHNSLTVGLGIYRNDNLFRTNSDYFRLYNFSQLELVQKVHKDKRSLNFPIVFSVKYTPSKKHTLNFSYFTFPNQSTEFVVNDNFGLSQIDSFRLKTNNSIKINGVNHDIGFQYLFRSDSNNFQFKVQFNSFQIINKMESSINESYFSAASNESNWEESYLVKGVTRNGNNFVNIENLHSFYSKRIELTYGLKLSYLRMRSKQDFLRYNEIIDFALSHDNLYYEDILAGYMQIKAKISNKLSAIVGLRYESVSSIGHNSFGLGSFAERNYYNWFPSIGLTYKDNRNISYTLYYSERIDRPNLNELNPAIYYLDSLSYRTGNPLLLPSYSSNFGFDITIKNTVYINTYTRNIRDFTSVLVHPLSNTSNTFVLNVHNFQRAQLSGINLSVPTPKIKGFLALVSIGWLHSKTWLNKDFTVSGNNFVFKFSPSFTSQKANLTFNGNFTFISAGVNGIFLSENLWQLDFGVYYKFAKRTNLKIGMSGIDIFNSMITRVNTNLPEISVIGTEFRDIMRFKIHLIYSFGIEKKQDGIYGGDERERILLNR